MTLYKESATAIHKRFKEGEMSAEEITSYFIKRIETFDRKTKSLLSIRKEKALEEARLQDAKRSKGEPLGKLAGVPIIFKDNMVMKDEVCTCASKFLQEYISPFTGTVAKRVMNEGGIVLGKANMDEFAMGSTNEYSAFHPSYNPWNLKCTPGGSSGGSAASVAARLAPLSFGSDTGGSVRQPASFCGIYGFKPSYGRLSRFGLVAFGSSLDQIGPFAHNIEDLSLLMEVSAGSCDYDSNSIREDSEPYLDELNTSIQGKTIGIPYEQIESLPEEIKQAYDSAIEVYKSLGVKTAPIQLKMLEYTVPVYYVLATAEASTNLARFDGIRYSKRSSKATTIDEIYKFSRNEGFGKEVKQRILLGSYVLSAGCQEAYYRKAQKVRTLMIQDYERAFQTCDVIALPTSPMTAFEVGSIQDPVTMYKQDIFTISANLAGIPSLSMPIGFDNEQKPIGLQLQAPILKDARALRFAAHFEKETNFAKEIPSEFDKETL